MNSQPITQTQRAATARFHERMARAFDKHGKRDDAKAARRAAVAVETRKEQAV